MDFKVLKNLEDVTCHEWNALVPDDYPFLRYEFLSALETSGAVQKETGWEPRHVALYHDGSLVALCPLYIKHHSYGEYVFDWSWADAYHRYGLDYYPKLITAVPFTPCYGARFLRDKKNSTEQVIPSMVSFIIDWCRKEQISSYHILFPVEDLSGSELSRREGVQYHWFNKGYKSFEDFLQGLQSRKRKNIKKERKAIEEDGIRFRRLTGHEISEQHIRHFYACYHSTYLKRGQQGYLNLAFFKQLIKAMPDNLLLIVAEKEERIVATALFFLGTETLYGRYWGCLEHFDHLHFETCYYQGIEFCIDQALQHFDAGAQGEHKLSRGFEPVITQSYHWLENQDFAHAIQNFVEEESSHIQAYAQELRDKSPYKTAD